MNPAGPQLLDIHLPAAPSWWPPAPGWWLLALVLALLAWLLSRQLRKLARRRALHRRFERELDALCARHPVATDAAGLVAGVSVLLRRIVAHHAPAMTNLREDAWLAFLDGEDASQPFSLGAGRILLDAPYRPRVDPVQADALLELVRASLKRWLERRHA